MYNYLCLSGGGTKTICTIGALQALYEKNLLNDVHTYIGSSAGAILGFLLSIGYTPKEIFDYQLDIDFNTLFNVKVTDFFNNYGLDNGRYFMHEVKKAVRKKKVRTALTFEDHFKETKKKLIVTGTCLTTRSVEYFDYTSHPKMKIIDALRISTSIPILFEYVTYDNKVYIDGGILDNLPMHKYQGKKNVIGIDIKNETCSVGSIQSYIASIILCMQSQIQILKNKNYNNVIRIDGTKLIAVDPNLKKEQKLKLFNVGYTEANKYILNLESQHVD